MRSFHADSCQQVKVIGFCLTVRGGGEAIAAGPEKFVDLIVSSEVPLRLPERIEPAHDLLSLHACVLTPDTRPFETRAG